MSKKHEVKQALGQASEELLKMSGKSSDEGFKAEVYDALKESIVELNKQLGRIEEAEKIARNLAQPAPGQDRLVPSAPPSAYKLYGKLKNFKDREIDGRMVRGVDQAFVAGQWCLATMFGKQSAVEWCKNNGISVEKAQGEGTDAAGGFLVPEELLASVITLREDFGVARQELQLIPMGRDTLNIPRRTGGVTATFTGENQTLTESQAAWDNVNVTAKKLTAMIKMSTEIDQDAVISIADWIAQEVAYAFAAKEDDCAFNGDGTSSYGGIRGSTVLAVDGGHSAGVYQTSSATLTSLGVADFTGVMGILPRYAKANAKWYMSQQMFFTAVATVLAKGGGNRLDILSNTIEEKLLGFPVRIAQKLPLAAPGSGKVQYHFGDLSKAAFMAERRGLTLKRSEHRFIDADQIGLFASERFDINIHDLGDGTNAGPLVSAKSP